MTTAAHEIAFIDSRIADYQTLIDGLAEGTEWFLLNSGEDGIGQMAKILSGYSNLDAIHVFSHGSPGALYLGSMVLDSSNLDAYLTPLQAIGSSLMATGDILLYGCEVAQGETGIQFISALAQVTGADVAASDDLTGSEALGGDWVLEQAHGMIDAESALFESSGFESALSSELPIATIFGSQGYYTTFANLSKAAYHLSPLEDFHIGQQGVFFPAAPHGDAQNYVKPYADVAWQLVNDETPGWTVVKDAQLNIGATGTADGNTWFLEADGIYHCNNAAAFAVLCGDALIVSFRGTNDNDDDSSSDDQLDWVNFPGHYNELQVFVDAVDAYAFNHNITTVYATGHSLGGAMALKYMSLHDTRNSTWMTADGRGISYEAVTFAAPGDTQLLLGDPRIVSIEIDKDPVPDIGSHHGYTVSVDVPLTHTMGEDIGKSYSATGDYHSMDLSLPSCSTGLRL